MSSELSTSHLLHAKHKSFLKACLNVFPDAYATLENSNLDLLDSMDEIDEALRKRIVEWIYRLQITSRNTNSLKACGFRGSMSNSSVDVVNPHDSGHLAMTYTGLACLLILDDDLSGVDRLGVIASVKACQLDDGSFTSVPGGSENDMRFVYCATVISFMLQDWSGLNQPKLLNFIKESLNYDGGIGQAPKLESHAGATYCALAVLKLLGKLDATADPPVFDGKTLRKIQRWCLFRQDLGFHGRANKPDDSCYSFWVGASLQMLNGIDFVGKEAAIGFTLSTQDEVVGGFSKYEDGFPDVLHTYLSLAGLSLLGHQNLGRLNAALNMSERSFEHLKRVQNSFQWTTEGSQCCKST